MVLLDDKCTVEWVRIRFMTNIDFIPDDRDRSCRKGWTCGVNTGTGNRTMHVERLFKIVIKSIAYLLLSAAESDELRFCLLFASFTYKFNNAS